MDVSAQQALQAAVRGDQAAWRQIIDAYSGRVYGLIYRQCGDRELAEEIVQATFVKVVDRLPAYREQGRFEPWLFRIALNRLRDEMRRRKRQAAPVDFATTPPEALASAHGDEPTPDQRLAEAEQIDRLRRTVAELPEADREVLHLRYTVGLSFQQIADTLGRPLGTVLARGHRALKKLKTKLAQSDEQSDG